MTKLASSTGNAQVDRILQGIIGVYELVFPDAIRAFYVIGSYADDSSVSISDIDLCIVFARSLTATQVAQARVLVEHCSRMSPVRLDIGLEPEGELAGVTRTLLLRGSRCVYGTDIRDTLHLPPLDAYRREVTWSPYRFLGQILRGQTVLRYPLDYPDPADRFYGYAHVRIAPWYPAGTQHGTKELITGVTRTATALLALLVQEYVGSKRASVERYRDAIGGEWVDYLQTLYRKGKGEWLYAIPALASEQQLLCDLCQQTLAFENHYFQHYYAYLYECLQGSAAEQRFAAQRLTEVVYTDEMMHSALHGLVRATSTPPDLQQLAAQALALTESVAIGNRASLA